jgi:hypothetical protein
MAKLYPPYLDGTVPSFYSVADEQTGLLVSTSITIPFATNKSVGINDIIGFSLKIKTIQTNTLVGTATVEYQIGSEEIKDIVLNQQVTFDLTHLNLTLGQYYKVQLAFIDTTSTVGYYSSTAIAKYTAKPLVYINGLLPTQTNNHIYSYTGVYSQQVGDATEKLHSSRFILKDSSGNVVADSGEIVHHTYDDVSSREAHENFVISNELEANKSYYMTYMATTNNGLVVESERYRIIKAGTVMPDMDITLSANLNYEEGFIDLTLTNHTIADNKTEKKVTGMFYIVRAASNDNYAWREMGNFSLQAQVPSLRLWKDYSIEQGVKYIYAIQQYNNYGLRSDRIESNQVIADFESAFLFDGKRQLKIKYNPKMSSFKRDVIEQKTDTIGSKYPFIFRNGNIDYHEFPISGLISYLGDENHQFLPFEELGLEVPTTQLTSDNITAERIFKMKTLEWLTNGEPKLFKSPTEGNFIVRLLNVSLSPNDTLGRLLHTFSATAYEIMDISYESLKSLGFVDAESDVVQTRYQSINIAGHSLEMDSVAQSIMSYFDLKVNLQLTAEVRSRIENATHPDGMTPIDIDKHTTALNTLILNNSIEGYAPLDALTVSAIAALNNKVTYASGKLNTRTAYSIDITGALPGTIFKLDDETIVIGASGTYHVEMPTGVKSIELPPKGPETQPNLFEYYMDNNVPTKSYIHPIGMVTYSYHSDLANIFDLYSNSQIYDYPARVWYGTPTREKYNPYTGQKEITHDIIQCIEDVKTTISKIYKVKFSKRYVQQIFAKDITETFLEYSEELGREVERKETRRAFYLDMDCKEELRESDFNPAYIYQVCKPREDYYYENYYQYTQWFHDANFRQGYYMSKGKECPFATTEMIDGLSKETFYYTDDFYTFSIGDNEVILEEQDITLADNDLQIDTITIGKGVVCEMSYQTKVMTFSAEIELHQVAKAKRELYNQQIEELELVKARILALSDEHIINHSSELQDLLKQYDTYLKNIDFCYNELVTYVAIAKKDFEEEMKS